MSNPVEDKKPASKWSYDQYFQMHTNQDMTLASYVLIQASNGGVGVYMPSNDSLIGTYSSERDAWIDIAMNQQFSVEFYHMGRFFRNKEDLPERYTELHHKTSASIAATEVVEILDSDACLSYLPESLYRLLEHASRMLDVDVADLASRDRVEEIIHDLQSMDE